MGSSSNSKNEDFTPPEEESLYPPSSVLEEGDDTALFAPLPSGLHDEVDYDYEEEAEALRGAGKVMRDSRELLEEIEARKPYRHEMAVIFSEQVRALNERLRSWVRKLLSPFQSAKGNSTKKTLSYVPKNSYSDDKLRFSTQKVDISVEEFLNSDFGYTSPGEEFFNLYKAITPRTVDMSLVTDDPELDEWQKTERLAVIRVRKNLVKRLCKKYEEEPQEIAQFFKLLMSDRTIGCDHTELSYACADNCLYEILQHVDDTSPEMFHEYLSDICLSVVENDEIGVLLTKKFAMSQLVEFKDARIVPIVKRLAEDESAILYEEAKLELYSAVKEMPRFFSDPKYDATKRVAEETKKSILYEHENPGIWG